MSKVLVVDDEKLIVKGLKFSLEQDGLTVDSAYDGEEALALIRENKYDIVLLDLMLPKMNGYEVCQEVRSFSDVPIVMLTAKSEDMDKILGLEMGADDYIAKPFRPRELLSRIKSVLRRTGKGDCMTIGNVQIDFASGIVEKNGVPVPLSALEYRMLTLLLNNRGRLMPRTKLLEDIWDAGGDFVNDNTLTVCVKRLREKLEDDPQNPTLIKTVRGIGYRVD